MRLAVPCDTSQQNRLKPGLPLLPCFLAAALLLLVAAAGAQAPIQSPQENTKQAERAADRGDKAAAAGKMQEALQDYAEAVRHAPGDLRIRQRAAAVRAQAVQNIVDQAEAAALDGDVKRSIELMYQALQIDPGNTIVAERLAQMKRMPAVYLPRGDKEDYALRGPAMLRPQPGKKNINVRGDSRSAYENVAGMFGIKVVFDPELTSRNVKLQVEGLDFYAAMQLLGAESKSFYRVVNPILIFVAEDTIEKRRAYSEEVEQTFPVDSAVAAEDLTEMMRVIREITNVTRINLDTKTHSLTMRDSADKVALAGQLLKELEQARRDVMLQIELLEADRTAARTLGITPPTSTQAITLSSSQLDQLKKATDLSNLLTLLSQVFTAQGISANIRNLYPVGGGLSTFLLSMPSGSATFSQALSLIRSGREVLMRAQEGKPATFFVGERFPVTLSLLSTSLGSSVVGGAVTSTIFPRTDFAVGANPVAIAAQDFNNDGLRDLAVVNQGDSSITILLNQNKGNFTAATGSPFKLGSNEQSPTAIASGIFRVTDAQHLVQPADLVVANGGSNTVSVLLGSQNFDGTFTEAAGSPFPVGTHPSAVVVGDFDGDGFLDFAVVNEGDSSISTFKGDGKGGFAEFAGSPFRMRGPLGIGTTSLSSGVVGAAYFTVLRAAGGTGAVKWAVTSGALPSGLTLNGSTGVISGTPSAPGTANLSITATDSATPAVSVTKNFSIAVSTTAPTFSIVTASLLNGTVGASYNQTLAATGGTQPYTWSVVGGLPPNLSLDKATGALTGTVTTAGSFDFTVQVTDSSATPLVATKQFTLTPNSPGTNDEQGPIAMTTGRFDNSGLPEIAVLNAATDNIAIFQANGISSGANAFNGTFTELSGSPVATGVDPVAFAAGDLNADGFADLAIVNQSANQVTVLINDGTGVFRAAAGSPLTTASTPAGVAIADFTNSGLGDIAVTNNGANTLGVYLGQGAGVFLPRFELSVAAGPTAITTADLTGAGLPDVALTAHSGSNNFVTVLLDPSSIAAAAAGNALQTPYPASELIDLGVKVKATPALHDNHEVTLQLEFEIRALAGTSVNGIPVITNRTVSQTVRLRENETSITSGLLDREETNSFTGIPGLANLPGLGYLFSPKTKNATDTELLILVTPLRMSERMRQAGAKYLGRAATPAAGAAGGAPLPQAPAEP